MLSVSILYVVGHTCKAQKWSLQILIAWSELLQHSSRKWLGTNLFVLYRETNNILNGTPINEVSLGSCELSQVISNDVLLMTGVRRA